MYTLSAVYEWLLNCYAGFVFFPSLLIRPKPALWLMRFLRNVDVNRRVVQSWSIELEIDIRAI